MNFCGHVINDDMYVGGATESSVQCVLGISSELPIRVWQSANCNLPITIHTNFPHNMSATDRIEFSDVAVPLCRLWISTS